jgi:hypothetical protein
MKVIEVDRRCERLSAFGIYLKKVMMIQSMETEDYFSQKKEKARTTYTAQREIYCPYFATNVVLNSDGFHHLQFSARRERNKKEQLFKFNLLPLGLELIRKSATMQEYRKLLTPIGKKSARDGSNYSRPSFHIVAIFPLRINTRNFLTAPSMRESTGFCI